MKLRNLLALLLLFVMGLQSIKAQEAYVVLNGGTMTFYYDNQRSSRPGTSYSITYTVVVNGEYYSYQLPWRNDALSVNRVVFDSSYANARPTSTYSWFYGMENLTSIEGMANLNTSEVTDMAFMFNDCKALTTLDLSHFNTAKVTDMTAMFQSCESLLILDLSSFNTSNVTDMGAMFNRCNSLIVLDVSSFNTENVTDMEMMFQNCEALTSLDLSSFDTRNVTKMGTMFWDCQALKYLILSNFNTSNVTDMNLMFCNCRSLTSLNLSSFNTANVTDMTRMFEDCKSLTALDLSNFNTENVTRMYKMFSYCRTLTSLNVSHFNTENVTDMHGMFDDCESLTSLDLSSFNTENVTDMKSMFAGCKSLTNLDLSNFNTENVTDMSWMFYYCHAFTSLDLGGFYTWSVTNLKGMFQECVHLITVDLSSFDTELVTDMSNMFYMCNDIVFVDLSSFNTAHVENMSKMFACCYDLSKIYVGADWNTNSVTSSDNMFNSCYCLRGDKGTEYNSSYVDESFANLDGGTSYPGYLSVKPFDFVKDGIFYKITGDNTVAVTNRNDFFDFYRDNVVIPASVDYHGRTYLVTAIEAKAFFFCVTMTGITIPSSVTDIGELAFEGCENLEKITCLAPTPPTIYANTFSNYDVPLIVPAGSKPLYQAASYWRNFTNIQEQKNYDFEYGGIYYKDMGGRTSAAVTYGDSDYGTYSGDVVIPEEVWNENDGWYYTVSQIGERAFYRCPSLKSVTIPATVDLIDGDAFLDSFVEFPTESSITCLAKNPPTVSPYAFGPGIADMTLYVRKGCKTAYEAANYWKNFGSIVELPYHFQVRNAYYQITGENTVSVVNRDANFYSYWSQVTIPATVTYEGVTYTVTGIANLAFFKCPELIRVIMPSTITSIGNRSFKDCTRLTSITIPENVQSIGVYAFDGCTALQEVNCWATEPPSIDYTTFSESHYQGVTLNVPVGCLDAYMFANVWELFYDIFDGIGDLKDSKDLIDAKDNIFNLSGQHLSKPQKGINIVGGRKILVK